MRNERTEARRRETILSAPKHRQTNSRDRRVPPPAPALPLLDWPKDLFSKHDVPVAANAD
jgi:hypothetical protein